MLELKRTEECRRTRTVWIWAFDCSVMKPPSLLPTWLEGKSWVWWSGLSPAKKNLCCSRYLETAGRSIWMMFMSSPDKSTPAEPLLQQLLLRPREVRPITHFARRVGLLWQRASIRQWCSDALRYREPSRLGLMAYQQVNKTGWVKCYIHKYPQISTKIHKLKIHKDPQRSTKIHKDPQRSTKIHKGEMTPALLDHADSWNKETTLASNWIARR